MSNYTGRIEDLWNESPSMRPLAASVRISIYREVDAVLSLDVPGIDTLTIEIFEFDMHSYSPLWSMASFRGPGSRKPAMIESVKALNFACIVL